MHKTNKNTCMLSRAKMVRQKKYKKIEGAKSGILRRGRKTYQITLRSSSIWKLRKQASIWKKTRQIRGYRVYEHHKGGYALYIR